MVTRCPDIAGTQNRRATNVAGRFGTAVVLTCNLFLILPIFAISIRGCSKAKTLTSSAPRA
jgi:hypothetical protein